MAFVSLTRGSVPRQIRLIILVFVFVVPFINYWHMLAAVFKRHQWTSINSNMIEIMSNSTSKWDQRVITTTNLHSTQDISERLLHIKPHLVISTHHQRRAKIVIGKDYIMLKLQLTIWKVYYFFRYSNDVSKK